MTARSWLRIPGEAGQPGATRRGARIVPALLLLTLVACETPPQERRPDVVVIVVDTLRADRLPTYGGPVDNAPFLSDLAERSIVFENAWSPSSWTLPAAISVLTSLHPFQHGVTSLVGLELGPDDEKVPVNVIPDGVRTMAEVLQSEGYRTYGMVSNILMGHEIELQAGFDRFVRLDDEPADVVQQSLRSWAAEMQAGEPFFLYLHYFDPHDPFHARAPRFGSALQGEGTAWPDGAPPDDGSALSDLDWIFTRLRPTPEIVEGRSAADMDAAELEQALDWMRAAYDSEVRFVDEAIADTFRLLELDDAVVVFLADHGEEFYEHGALTHGFNLHVETTRVPLFVYPGRESESESESEAGRRVAHHVSTLDVLPTVRALVGLPPSARDQGRDLLGEGDRGPVFSFLPGKAEKWAPQHDQFAVTDGRYRLLFSDLGERRLFDLLEDPGETRDLAASMPEQVEAMLTAWRRLDATAPRIPRTLRIPSAIDENLREHLEGIGYLGN